MRLSRKSTSFALLALVSAAPLSAQAYKNVLTDDGGGDGGDTIDPGDTTDPGDTLDPGGTLGGTLGGYGDTLGGGGILDPIDTLDPGAGGGSGTGGGSAGGCPEVGEKTDNDATMAEWSAGLGDWEWGMDLQTDVGFSADCLRTKLSANAGLDVKLYGIGVPAVDIELAASIASNQHKSLDFTMYALNQEFHTIPITESDASITDWRSFDITLPGQGLSGGWQDTFSVGQVDLNLSLTTTFTNTIRGSLIYDVQSRRAFIELNGEINVSANVTGTGALQYNGTTYGSATVSADAVGFVGNAQIRGEAKGVYQVPPGSDTVSMGKKTGAHIEDDNAWQVDVFAYHYIFDAVRTKMKVKATAHDVPVPGIGETDITIERELVNLGGLPESLWGARTNELHKIYPFVF